MQRTKTPFQISLRMLSGHRKVKLVSCISRRWLKVNLGIIEDPSMPPESHLTAHQWILRSSHSCSSSYFNTGDVNLLYFHTPDCPFGYPLPPEYIAVAFHREVMARTMIADERANGSNEQIYSPKTSQTILSGIQQSQQTCFAVEGRGRGV